MTSLAHEEKIQQELAGRFASLSSGIKIQRARRIFVEVPYEQFEKVLEFSIGELGFSILLTITGLDDGAFLTFIYHLARPGGMTLSLRTGIPKATPTLKTVIAYFPNADIYERELIDLLGAKIDGLPEGKRYPLSDDWPKGQYPLRKDWKTPSSPGIKEAPDA